MKNKSKFAGVFFLTLSCTEVVLQHMLHLNSKHFRSWSLVFEKQPEKRKNTLKKNKQSQCVKKIELLSQRNWK